MLISLDFDGTFSSDPKFWLLFARDAVVHGHRVITVTHRRKTFDNEQAMRNLGVNWPIIFAYDQPKKMAAIEHGFAVDVWVDDHPEGVGTGDEQQPTTQSVFEIELRNAYQVLTDGNLRMNEFAELITRLETILVTP